MVFIVCELVLVHLRCALLVLIMDRVAYAETRPVTTRVEVDEGCPAAWPWESVNRSCVRHEMR